MNDHINELITGYLHGGNTPDQDKELFEACSKRPGTAELLRMQILLSLKLRSLREQTEVPADLHNATLSRINEVQAGRERESPHTRSVTLRPTPRYSWVHVFGASLSTALAALLLLMLYPDQQPPSTAMHPVVDTVRLVERDTVLQIHEVSKPVYITRTIVEPRLPGSIQEVHDVGTTPGENITDAGSAATQSLSEEELPSSEVSPVREQKRQIRVNQYLEQYNTMLATVETVKLSATDRIAQ